MLIRLPHPATTTQLLTAILIATCRATTYPNTTIAQSHSHARCVIQSQPCGQRLPLSCLMMRSPTHTGFNRIKKVKRSYFHVSIYFFLCYNTHFCVRSIIFYLKLIRSYGERDADNVVKVRKLFRGFQPRQVAVRRLGLFTGITTAPRKSFDSTDVLHPRHQHHANVTLFVHLKYL